MRILQFWKSLKLKKTTINWEQESAVHLRFCTPSHWMNQEADVLRCKLEVAWKQQWRSWRQAPAVSGHSQLHDFYNYKDLTMKDQVQGEISVAPDILGRLVSDGVQYTMLRLSKWQPHICYSCRYILYIDVYICIYQWCAENKPQAI